MRVSVCCAVRACWHHAHAATRMPHRNSEHCSRSSSCSFFLLFLHMDMRRPRCAKFASKLKKWRAVPARAQSTEGTELTEQRRARPCGRRQMADSAHVFACGITVDDVSHDVRAVAASHRTIDENSPRCCSARSSHVGEAQAGAFGARCSTYGSGGSANKFLKLTDDRVCISGGVVTPPHSYFNAQA